MTTKNCWQDRLLSSIVHIIIILALIATLYPFIFILVMSFSDLETILKSGVVFFPKKLFFGSYQVLFRDPEIWTSYYNTIWYAVVGTFFNVIFTVVAAFVLSRKKFIFRKILTKLFLITMIFSGGTIPTYILMLKAGLYNTRLAMVVPGLIGVWFLIICKTFIETSIPDEMVEAYKLESNSELGLLIKIVVPLCLPIIATIILFYAINHWNAFFDALIYLKDASLQPLQIYLRKILMGAARTITDAQDYVPSSNDTLQQMLYIQIKYAVIIVTVLPILIVYPFIQKYFVKGIMIGSVKG